MMQSGLYRSSHNKMIAGVMGGVAERFGWNANLLRILFVGISILSAAFPGILIYLILWFIIPVQSQQLHAPTTQGQRNIRTVYDEGQPKR